MTNSHYRWVLSQPGACWLVSRSAACFVAGVPAADRARYRLVGHRRVRAMTIGFLPWRSPA